MQSKGEPRVICEVERVSTRKGDQSVKSSAPIVSVGIPVLNGGKTLRHTLNSLLAQSLADFEVVISDNASTDDTREICQEYAEADPRIRYFRNGTNLGARANYNRVFQLARGEYFRWNGHDDWIDPTYLERCLEAFRRDPAAVACYTGRCRVADNIRRSKVTPAHKSADSERQARRFHDSLWSMPYHPIFGMFKSAVLAQTDLIPNCPEPDRITLAQVALLGRFAQVDQVLFFQRHPRGGRDVWTWLDPANTEAPKRRVVRVTKALWQSVDRFAEDGRPQCLLMKADALAFVGVQTVRGKFTQFTRVFKYRRRVKTGSAAVVP